MAKKEAASTLKKYRNICDRTINVDAKPLEPGAIVEIPSNMLEDLGIVALVANSYLEEVKG